VPCLGILVGDNEGRVESDDEKLTCREFSIE
jgi:hypothetical protein